MTPLVVGLALILAAPAPKKNEEPPAKLEGEWVVEKFEGPKDDAPPGTVTMKFADNKISINDTSGKGHTEEAGFTVDATQKPAHIDIKPDRGGDKLVMGIYEIKGDTLKICFGKDSGVRPTAFAPDAAKGVLVI